ncbi:MAG TPA: hypothetical protein VLD59_14735 [Steroidobacteraceae bacterium]|nr:hypothetical protein [Steroidobacteraceae bacterium]
MKPCRKHDWELTGVRVEDEVRSVETCSTCGAERERAPTRRTFASAVVDRAKKLERRGARGRQARLAFKELAR